MDSRPLIESDGPDRPERRDRPLHFGEEGRARLDARGGSKLIGAGSPCASRPGRASIIRRSTISSYYYYSAPKKDALKSIDEIDPEILATYEKLGIPLRERDALLGITRGGRHLSRVAVDAVFDSVSVATTSRKS